MIQNFWFLEKKYFIIDKSEWPRGTYGSTTVLPFLETHFVTKSFFEPRVSAWFIWNRVNAPNIYPCSSIKEIGERRRYNSSALNNINRFQRLFAMRVLVKLTAIARTRRNISQFNFLFSLRSFSAFFSFTIWSFCSRHFFFLWEISTIIFKYRYQWEAFWGLAQTNIKHKQTHIRVERLDSLFIIFFSFDKRERVREMFSQLQATSFQSSFPLDDLFEFLLVPLKKYNLFVVVISLFVSLYQDFLLWRLYWVRAVEIKSYFCW